MLTQKKIIGGVAMVAGVVLVLYGVKTFKAG